MQRIILQRSFLKSPSKGIIALIIVVLLAYIGLLANRKDIVTEILSNLTFFYLFRQASTIILPELMSLFILIALINGYHRVMRLESIDLSIEAIARYEFKFAPLFFLAYFAFFPVTLHLRFLLREFPDYSLSNYYNTYLINGFSVNTYMFYLPFVFVLGYALLNVSLFIDFSPIQIKEPDLPTTKITKDDDNVPIAQQTDLVDFDVRAEKIYLNIVEVKTKTGTTFLNISDCHYFTTTNDNQNIVAHSEGSFKIIKSISAIEADLDPLHFFRCNRKTIVNLRYTGSFTYLDKGRYNITMKNPIVADFYITKARIDLYKIALKRHIEHK